jgi:hypothetical protein
MKKTLVLLLFLAGCGTPKPPATGGTHYTTPAVITVNPGNGKAIACYGIVTIEQVDPRTYDIYWTDAQHKEHVIRGVHDVEVTDPAPGDITCK